MAVTSVYIQGKRQLFADLKNMKEKINKGELNQRRANGFAEYVKDKVASGALSLRELSGATEIISSAKGQSGPHMPEYDTGALINAMLVKHYKNQKSAVGYFKGMKKHPGSKKYNAHQLAVLQHTGYRIPLIPSVIAFYKNIGLFDEDSPITSSGKKFIQVPPRPFLFIAAKRFARSGADQKIIEDFLKEL